jgi:hypothetical protein
LAGVFCPFGFFFIFVVKKDHATVYLVCDKTTAAKEIYSTVLGVSNCEDEGSCKTTLPEEGGDSIMKQEDLLRLCHNRMVVMMVEV